MKTKPRCNQAVLRRIALFAPLSDDRIEALAQAAQHRRYKRGSTIMATGRPADGVFIILAGRAKAVMADGHGRVMTLSVIETHDFFGSVGPVEHDESSSVEALDACEVLYIPAGPFRVSIAGNYEAAMLIVSSVQARLWKAQRTIGGLGLLDVYGRVSRFLVESARQVDGRWLVETGSEEIARTVAASREMVSRVVRKMRAQGFVLKDRRNTVILDRDSMAAPRPS